MKTRDVYWRAAASSPVLPQRVIASPLLVDVAALEMYDAF
jgi:hypothetical protein